MEAISTKVVEVDEKFFIEIACETPIRIPMSEDDANEVKKSFNKLILLLKKGMYKLDFQSTDQDLISQVAKEYVNQLNKEIQEVYGEMEGYGLIDK